MENLDSQTLITIITTIVAGIGIVLGTAIPALVEGRAAVKALEGMARQPEAAGNLRTTMLIAMATLETTAIYVLVVVLILLFGTS